MASASVALSAQATAVESDQNLVLRSGERMDKPMAPWWVSVLVLVLVTMWESGSEETMVLRLVVDRWRHKA